MLVVLIVVVDVVVVVVTLLDLGVVRTGEIAEDLGVGMFLYRVDLEAMMEKASMVVARWKYGSVPRNTKVNFKKEPSNLIF